MKDLGELTVKNEEIGRVSGGGEELGQLRVENEENWKGFKVEDIECTWDS